MNYPVRSLNSLEENVFFLTFFNLCPSSIFWKHVKKDIIHAWIVHLWIVNRWIIVTQIFSCDYGWIVFCEIAQTGKKKISILYRLKLINDSYEYSIDFLKKYWKRFLENAESALRTLNNEINERHERCLKIIITAKHCCLKFYLEKTDLSKSSMPSSDFYSWYVQSC